MKKILTIIALMAFVGMAAKADNLKQGDKIVKTLELEFDEQAKIDNVFISWELSGDWNQFDYSFSQGTLKGNVYTIRANEYKDFANGHDGIALTIEGKDETSDGVYNLAMHVTEVTENLDFPKEDLNGEFQIKYILPPPPPCWKKLLILGLILLFLILIGVLIFHFTAKFPDGLLQLGQEEVQLKGKKIVSVKTELEQMNIQLAEGIDVILVKKRFKSFKGPCIKEMNNCTLECEGDYLSKGDIILSDQEVKGLKDIHGKDILIRYI